MGKSVPPDSRHNQGWRNQMLGNTSKIPLPSLSVGRANNFPACTSGQGLCCRPDLSVSAYGHECILLNQVLVWVLHSCGLQSQPLRSVMPTAQTGRCGRCLASLLFWDTQPWVLSSAACSPPPLVLDLSFYFPDSGHFCFLCLDFSLNCGND